MAKALKWILLPIAVVLVLAVVLIIALGLLIDEAQIKQTLANQVRQQTGAELRIDGALGWTLWPHLGVRVHDVAVTPEGETSALLSAREVTVALQIKPLLHKEIRVDGLSLVGLDLNGQLDASGRPNWASLLGETSTSQVSPGDAVAVAAAPLALEVSRLQIAEATLNYADASSGRKISVTGLSLDARDVNLDGRDYPLDLEFAYSADGSAATHVALQTRIAVDQLAQQIALTGARIKLSSAGMPALQIETAGTVALATSRADFQSISVEADGLTAKAGLAADWSGPSPAFSVPLNISKLDLPVLIRATGGALPDSVNAKTLDAISVNAQINGADGRISVADLVATVDQLVTRGDINYDPAGSPQLQSTLHMNRFDPAVLLLAGTEAEPAAEEPGDLPLAAIGVFDALLVLRVDELQYAPWQARDVDLRLRTKDGVLRITRLKANAYGGQVNATGRLGTRRADARLELDAKVDGIDIPAVLAVLESPPRFAGSLNATAKLAMTGNNSDAWLRTVSGPVDVRIDKGVLKGMNIEQSLCEGVAMTNQQELTATFPADTVFDTLTAAVAMDKGVARLQPLNATTSNIRLGGSGAYVLDGSTFDMVLTARLLGSLPTQDPACRVNKRLLEIDWPLRCKGQLDGNPTRWCGIDNKGMEAIVKQLLGSKVEKEMLKGLNKLFNKN